LVKLAHGNVYALLLMGAIASAILGMGLTVTACYILLSLVMAPALIEIGLNPLAVHLFIIYCGMLSYITPPVALGAFAASGLAGESAMKIGYKAMRLGIILYIIPFSFVLKTELIAIGPVPDIAISIVFALAAITVIGGSLEAYMPKIGKIPSAIRVPLFITGVLLLVGKGKFQYSVAGFIVFLLLCLIIRAVRFGRGEKISPIDLESITKK
jgi:TRAP-type uncharacterized transport system fused permease subunit